MIECVVVVSQEAEDVHSRGYIQWLIFHATAWLTDRFEDPRVSILLAPKSTLDRVHRRIGKECYYLDERVLATKLVTFKNAEDNPLSVCER